MSCLPLIHNILKFGRKFIKMHLKLGKMLYSHTDVLAAILQVATSKNKNCAVLNPAGFK